MINGTHEHQCRFCQQRFECAQITHCKKMSNDPDEIKRPVCYSDECQEKRQAEQVAEIERSGQVI